MPDARHGLEREQIVGRRTEDATEGDQADDEVEGERDRGDPKERIGERGGLRDERQRHERDREEGQEHADPRERLVVGERSSGGQTRVLGGENAQRSLIPG
jgi:hypothetical protein